MKIVLLSQFTLQALFPPNTALQDRLRLLDPFFDPPLGSEIKADPAELREKRDRPLDIQGYVKISPPPGRCFILRKSPKEPDQNICKAKDVAFSMRELREDGSIQWLLIQGPNDSGTPIMWQTPYRLARVIELGQFDSAINKTIPIASCEAEENSFQRKLTLTLMSGQKWIVLFPEKDIPLAPERKIPNLFVRVLASATDGNWQPMEASSGGEFKGSDERSANYEPDSDRHALLALRLSGRYKEIEDEVYRFNFEKRGSFEMNSSQVQERSAPIGMNGLCRYRYQGAPLDPQSGVIECFNSESYDALYMHLTCSGQFAPKID